MIDIEGVQFDIDLAIKRVKCDMRDDWFQDPFLFEDYLKPEIIKEKLEKFKLKYEPTISCHFDIPKSGFVIRHSIETNMLDRIMYQALVDKIAPYFDKILKPNVYSHRLDNQKGHERYFFINGVEQWLQFNRKIESELNETNPILLVTDLTNFFENINVNLLIDELKKNILPDLKLNVEEEKECKKVLEMLFKLLKKWTVPHTQRGISQNRNPSSFLANIYLSSIDHEMISNGYNYYRYMDDIRFTCPDRFKARKYLKDLIAELRKKGLNVNSKKTQILNKNNPDDQVKLTDFLPSPDRTIEGIDSRLKKKRAEDIQQAVPMLRRKILELIRDKKTQDREFRFCVNRFETLLRNKTLKGLIDVSEIIPRIIIELIEQPWSSDSFIKFLRCVQLNEEHFISLTDILSNPDKSVYEWQSYYLWQLMVSHDYKSDSLIKLARKNIKDGRSLKPEIAGSCLYLAALGTVHDKMFIANNFSNFTDFFTQRLALISVKDLDYKTVIEKHVKPYILPEYEGCYSVLNSDYKDMYINPPQPLRMSELFNYLPDIIS